MGEGSIESYRDLRVWREAMDLVEACYRLSAGFPRREIFTMTAQLRRAAISVPANIAERYGRDSTGSYVQYPKVAQGSLKELETHLLLSQRLGFAPARDIERVLERCAAVGKMLRSLIRSVQRAS
jgi:four helix bundle protein